MKFFTYLKHIFIRFFISYCPNKKCNGVLKYDFYDGEFDRNVYKCDKCGVQWI